MIQWRTDHPHSTLPFRSLLKSWEDLGDHFIVTKAISLVEARKAWQFACHRQRTEDLKFNLHVGATKKDEAYVCRLFVPSAVELNANDLIDHADCSCKNWSETKKARTDRNHPCSHLLVLCLYGHFLFDFRDPVQRDHAFRDLLPPRRLGLPLGLLGNGMSQMTKDYFEEQPKLPGPGDCLAACPPKLIVRKSTRRGWVYEVSKPEELKRYLKMRFLEDGWALAETCRAGAEQTGTDIGHLRVLWDQIASLKAPAGWVEPNSGWFWFFDSHYSRIQELLTSFNGRPPSYGLNPEQLAFLTASTTPPPPENKNDRSSEGPRGPTRQKPRRPKVSASPTPSPSTAALPSRPSAGQLFRETEQLILTGASAPKRQKRSPKFLDL